MTLEDWLDPRSNSERQYHLLTLSDRKLHLLTAAFLRRVWDDLPSEHTRGAVKATEQFADGWLSATELARLRSTDLLDSCERLWTNPGYLDEDLIGLGCPCCEWTPRTYEYECRLAHNGYVLDGVRAAVDRPADGVLRASRLARDIVAWNADPETREEAQQEESRVQYEVFQEIAGPGWTDPRWRTFDVLALARGIYRDQAYDRLPILADALQDAGCDDEVVLSHCREKKHHVRGCWVVDLGMGSS